MADAAVTRSQISGKSSLGGSGNPIAAASALIQKYRGVIVPSGFITLVMVIMIPLPTWIIDILLTANIAIASVILVSVVYVKSPLELAVFPSLLLGTTLFRLVLNVASTRLILTAGERASTAESASSAAGHVIEQFANFVAAGNLVIGIIIFVILIIIQFVVITKGATRIAEVAARFTLDAMPGKQMAIDADLNAGLIKEDEARKRRDNIAKEAEFYGAMDGASKFVRGDAIAGILITVVNVIGGIAIGMLQYGWQITDCFKVFTRLTIGEGLVSQVPAFIISLAAGLLVTRSAADKDMGEDLIHQMTSKTMGLSIASVFLVALSFTGMPMLPMWIIAACMGGIAYVVTKNNKASAVAKTKADKQLAAQSAAKKSTDKVESLLPVDAMELEVGYGLVQMVDTSKGGDLLERISLIRRQIAIELGVVVPPIRIRDNMQINPDDYVIKMRGNAVATGTVHPGQFLAMDSGAVSGNIVGEQTKEPAFGLPAVWIQEAQRSQAEMMNYTVVEAAGVMATHLTEVVKGQAAELVTREEVQAFLKQLKEKAPSLVEEVVPSQIKPGELQKVLQNLLRERIPIRDLETILETLSEWAIKTKDLDILTEAVRNGLSRTICGLHKDENNTIHCVTLDPALEDLINGYIERNERGAYLTLPPQVGKQIVEAINKNINKLLQQGHAGVVLCSPQVRAFVRKMIESALPTVSVLSYNEIVKGVNVESVGIVGANS